MNIFRYLIWCIYPKKLYVSLGGVTGFLGGANPLLALGGVGNQLLGGAMDYYNNKRLMERSHGFQKEMMQNQYQWKVRDLQAAGINPLLAVHGGMSGSPGSAASGSVPGGRVNQDKRNEYESLKAQRNLTIQQGKLLNKQALQADTQAILNSAKAQREFTETLRSQTETTQTREKLKLTRAQWLTAEAKLVPLANEANVHKGNLGEFLAHLKAFNIDVGSLLNILASAGVAFSLRGLLGRFMGKHKTSKFFKTWKGRGEY